MVGYNNEASPAAGIFLAGVKGFLVSVIAAAVMLFAFAGIAYSAENPDQLTSVLGYAALFLTAAIAGGTAGRLSRESGGASAIAGAAAGVILLLAVLLMSFIPAEAPSEPLSPVMCAAMYAAVPAIAALSGFVLRMRKKVRRHRRRR